MIYQNIVRLLHRFAYTAVVAAVLFPALLWSGTGADNKNTKTTAAEKKWKVSLSGGLTLSSGNTESLLVSGGTKINYTSDKIQFLTVADAFYGTGKEEKLVNKGKWNHKLILRPFQRFSMIGVTTIEYDKFSDVGLRGNGGLGIRWKITEPTDKKTSAQLAATLNGEWTRTVDTKDTTSSMRLNMDLSLDRTLSKTAKFSMTTLFTSGLDDVFGDFRLETRASLSVKVKNPLSLKVEIHDKYTHQPLAPEIKKNDFILVTSLEVSF